VSRCRPLATWLTAAVLALSAGSPALGNGGKSKATVYEAELRQPASTGDVRFSASLERVLFGITSVAGKYKVIRIQIDNFSRTTLRLAGNRDRVAVDLGNRTVAGILNLSSTDRALWDSLPAELRQALAYPPVVEPGEQESVFVFLAEPSLTALPVALRYRIDSRNLELDLVERGPTAE